MPRSPPMDHSSAKQTHAPNVTRIDETATSAMEDCLTQVVQYQNPLEQYNSTLKVAWSESLDESELPLSTTYKNVHVLMLSWEQKHDDLKVHGEVDDLRKVFEEDYKFKVTRGQLQRKEKKKTQTQINRIVAEWVDINAAYNTLLIVYFAGHGRPGKDDPLTLEIAGQKVASDELDYLDNVVWNKTERLLEDGHSDVLQIFDCCHAGAIGSRGEQTIAMEFLAATNAQEITLKPGPHSFTTALIWALKQLAGGGKFTTSQLTSKIKECPNFPEEQKPVLSKRNYNNNMIMIQPLSSVNPSTEVLETSTPEPEEEASDHYVLPLKFMWQAQPDQQHVRKLAEGLFNLIHKHKMPVSRVVLGDVKLKPRPREENEIMRKVVKHWRRYSGHGSRKRKAASTAPSSGRPSPISRPSAGSDEHIPLSLLSPHHARRGLVPQEQYSTDEDSGEAQTPASSTSAISHGTGLSSIGSEAKLATSGRHNIPRKRVGQAAHRRTSSATLLSSPTEDTPDIVLDTEGDTPKS